MMRQTGIAPKYKRKAALLDGLAVTLLLIVSALLGAAAYFLAGGR